MNGNKIFYLKIFLILTAAFFVWLFGRNQNAVLTSAENAATNGKPTALVNFSFPLETFFEEPENTFPKRNWSIPVLELNAQAAIAIKTDGSRIYYNKNIATRRPIASLTKMMTAIIVLENFNLDDVVTIPLSAVQREGVMGNLRPSENITVRSLLSIMLIDSSNDAAAALAAQKNDFVSLMNKKAKTIGLEDTNFKNFDGLDAPENYSSALDAAKIFSYLIKTHPEAFEILKIKNMVVYSSDGAIEHRLENTNELLETAAGVIAGKTGYTDQAGGCLILLINGNIITVILGSPDRFGESEKLINWLEKAYIWQ